jgi:hypothetical protein
MFFIHNRHTHQTGRDEYTVMIGRIVEEVADLITAKTRVQELHAEAVKHQLMIPKTEGGCVTLECRINERPQYAVLDKWGEVIFTYGT